MTAADTQRAAKTILKLIGPDPDAARHRADLSAAIGLKWPRDCQITGCPQDRKALGLCAGHYRAHRRATRNEDFAINRKPAS